MDAYRHDPCRFIDDFLPLNEKGQPWKLSPHQRRVIALAFRWSVTGQLLLGVLLWGEMKKSGKTLLAAALELWHAYTNGNTLVINAANDMDQAVGRVFATAVDLLKHNPTLGKSATVKATEIKLANGTIIKAIPSDYRGSAGERHSLVVYDELWAYDSERARRLYEELTPPPTEPNAWVLVVTYAGFTGESTLLEELYQRGLAGERMDDELEVTQADDLCMFWSHTPRQPWQLGEAGERYYARQRRLLRPSTYARLHENRWVTAESTFITDTLWDACVDPDALPVPTTTPSKVFLGVDASVKNDTTAIVAVARDGDRIRLVKHWIWRPTKEAPMNLEETVERVIREVYAGGNLEACYVDPYQLHRSMTTLKAGNVPVQEFSQTTGNVTKMGESLFDALKGRTLVMYPDAELRQQALNTVAVDNTRGWRIAKEKGSRKIDGIVALSMAIVASLDKPTYGPPRVWGMTGELREMREKKWADPITGETIKPGHPLYKLLQVW